MIVDKYKDKNFVTVTRQEALLLIKSLTTQLINNESNIGRLESYTDDGEYYSIAVLPDHWRSTGEYNEWVKSGAPPLSQK